MLVNAVSSSADCAGALSNVKDAGSSRTRADGPSSGTECDEQDDGIARPDGLSIHVELLQVDDCPADGCLLVFGGVTGDGDVVCTGWPMCPSNDSTHRLRSVTDSVCSCTAGGFESPILGDGRLWESHQLHASSTVLTWSTYPFGFLEQTSTLL